jgi:hypothetical protein
MGGEPPLQLPESVSSSASGEAGPFLRITLRITLWTTDLSSVIGSSPGHGYERSGERTTWRYGHRERVLDTRLGSLQLRIPKVAARQLLPVVPRLKLRNSTLADRSDGHPRLHRNAISGVAPNLHHVRGR